MRTKYSIGTKIEFEGKHFYVEKIRLVKDEQGACLMYTLSNGSLVSFDTDGNVYEVLNFNIVKN